MLELDVRLTADKQVQTNSQADLKKILQWTNQSIFIVLIHPCLKKLQSALKY